MVIDNRDENDTTMHILDTRIWGVFFRNKVSLECDFISSRNYYGVVRTLFLAFSIFFLFCFLVPSLSLAQQSSQYDEVIFGYTLKELGSYNISVAAKNDRIFLPVIELFNIFEVYYTIEGQNIIKGTYISSALPMTIDPVRHEITLGNKVYVLTLEEMFKGEMDIYISTEKFEEIFGISSTVNINRLQIIVAFGNGKRFRPIGKISIALCS